MPEVGMGRIVHYVLEEGPSKGESRPAQIVQVFAQREGPPLLNLVVTLDGFNDRLYEGDGHAHEQRDTLMTKPDDSGRYSLHVWRTSVTHAEAVGTPPTFVPGTWHWPQGVN